jgi:hypothetical protein
MFLGRQLLSLPLAAVLVLAGCSSAGPAGRGGSGILPENSARVAPAPAHRRTTTTFSIRIPKRVRVGGRNHPHFVSPSTQSATISIAPNSGCASCTPAFTQKLGLTAGSKNCVTNSSGTICSFTFAQKPGNYTGTMTTYDGALDKSGNPTGAVLSQDQSFPLTVVLGKANVPTISLYGVPANIMCLPITGASISIAVADGSCNQGLFKVAAGVTSRFAIYALDIDGNLMLGPGAPTFSASASGFTFSTAGNVVSVTPPTISASLSALTLTATSPACQVPGAVWSFMDLLVFDSAVAIADSANNTVAVFSRLQIQAGAGAPHALITGITAPTAVAFDTHGNLFVASGSSQANSMVREYAPPYTGAPAATMTTNLNLPFAIAIGKNGRVGVLNGGTATAEVFAPPYTGAPLQASLATSDATALAFDSSENLWISFFSSNNVERFPLAFLYGGVDTLLDHVSNGITHPSALQLDSNGNLYVGEGQVDLFPSPYSGMPTKSSSAVANITSMEIDGTHGYIAACGSSEVDFFHNSDLSYAYSRNTPATCGLAFDRLHDLEMVFASPAGALTISYDGSFWSPGRSFTSTALSAPAAVATWP